MIWLVQDDALGEWSSIARLDVKLNGLTFDERLTTFSLNLRVVHKDVGLAIDTGSGGNHNGNLNSQAYWRTVGPPNISRDVE